MSEGSSRTCVDAVHPRILQMTGQARKNPVIDPHRGDMDRNTASPSPSSHSTMSTTSGGSQQLSNSSGSLIESSFGRKDSITSKKSVSSSSSSSCCSNI